MGLIQRLLNKMQELLEGELQERAISMSALYSRVYDLVVIQDPMVWINDIYSDGQGGLFVILSSGGRLWQAPVMVDGNSVMLGEWVEVVQEFAPVGRALTIRRQADGRVRWFMVAGSAVLNRGGEIDSRDLFDSFVEHVERTGEYPEFVFFHFYQEEGSNPFRLGQADWVAREDNLYLASGLFDTNNPLADVAILALERDAAYWGNSIGFKYREGEGVELVELASDVLVPVYRKGINHEISLLPEREAAAWFTSILAMETMKERGMEDRQRAALAKLFGSEEEAERWLAGVSDVNRQIERQGLITRQTETGAEGEGEEEDESTDEVVLDEDAVAAIVEQAVLHPAFKALETAVQELRERTQSADKVARAAATDIQRVATQTEARLAALEADDETKRQRWESDLPRRTRQHVTFRPREQRGQDDAGGSQEETYADVADRTLETISGK